LDFRLELLFDDRPFLSRVQAAHQLCVPVANLMEWKSKGLISCSREKGLGWQFRRADVECFEAQYMLLTEAAFLLDVSVCTVRQWMKNDRLFPVSGPGVDGCKRLLFRRADVERLRLSNSR
jgi:predicted site-specific integrase-resolvase